MRKAFKASNIVILSLLLICSLIFFGYRSFVSSIQSQRTCEWANIDNIEMHAHVDIPRVTTWDCNYEQEQNTKKAQFTIDRRGFDINRYIKLYKLKELTAATEIQFDKFLNMKIDSVGTKNFYYKIGSQDGEKWDVLLDKDTGKLWVTIKYKN